MVSQTGKNAFMNSKLKNFFRAIPFSSLPINCYKAYVRWLAYRTECQQTAKIMHLKKNQKKIFFFGVARFYNMGDLAQTMCIRNWFMENYPELPVCEIYDSTIVNPRHHFPQLLQKVLGKDDLIFFQSGYNTQDIGGYQDEMHRIICDNFPDARIVFMPQTVLFQKEENRLRTAKSHDACRRALFLGRDNVSTQIAKTMFPHLPVFCYPDIVTTLIGQYHPDFQRDGIFFCVRNDLEKLYRDQELRDCADAIAQAHQLNVTFGDTEIEVNHTTLLNNVPRFVNVIIERIAKYRLVVTDRYHGTIFSLIANTPVIVIPSNDHKITTGVDWFKGIYDDRVVLAKSLEQVPALAQKILARPALPPPEPYFKAHYYDQLKELIERCTREE